MQRKSHGGKRFSFTRFVANSFPNLASAPVDNDLNIAEKDATFELQLEEPEPIKLGHRSYISAGITSSTFISTKIDQALLKNGTIEAKSGRINTSKITKNFAHELSFITSHAQKKLINLLFFWEEEVMRMNVLRKEAEELSVLVEEERKNGGEDRAGALEKRRLELLGLLSLKPSLRGEDARNGEALPGYTK